MKNLSAQEAEDYFGQIISGKVPENDIAEFLLALKEKGESKDEILGAVRAVKKTATLPSQLTDALDVCGTGGDGLHTLNISTAVSFVVAACGVKVAKHGNKAVSSSSGSSDVLSELGIKLDADPVASISGTGFGYFHAPLFYPALKNIAPIRAKLKTRTIFNLLGPLLNPVGAGRQLIGVYSPNLLRTYAEVLRELGCKKAWIVHGSDGLDEISISGPTQVAELEAGAIDMFEITPEDAGLRRSPLEDIKGGDARHNAQMLNSLLKGEKGAYREIVLLNAAAALIVSGVTGSLEEGVRLAAESIDSGRALKVLEQLREI